MVGRGLSIGDPKKKWLQPAVDPAPTAAVEPAPTADPYGYVEPPTDTSGFGGFMNQLKYINRTSPSAFMQLGAGIMGNDVAGGISGAGQAMDRGALLQQRAREKLYGYREEQKSKNLTRQWLRSRFPEASETDLDAAIANPTIMNELLAPPDKRNLIEVDGKIYDADTDTWIEPGGTGGFDLGDSLEGRALEYLVQQKLLTPTQAADVAAGKQITAPDGSIWFKRASDLVGAPDEVVRKTPDGKEEVVSGGAENGGKQLTPTKKVEPTESMRRDAKLYTVAQPELNIALQNFDALNTVRNTGAQLLTKLPGIAGDIGSSLQGWTSTAEYQRANRAVDTIIRSSLYSVSGANAPEGEVADRIKSVMPFPGEDAASVADKKRRLAGYVEAIRLGSIGKGIESFVDLDRFIEGTGSGNWTVEEVQ